jgi:hypothetical protein
LRVRDALDRVITRAAKTPLGQVGCGVPLSLPWWGRDWVAARPTCRRTCGTAFETAPPSDAVSKAPRQPSPRFHAAQWVEAAHCDPTSGVRGRGHGAVPARGSVRRRLDAVLGPGQEGTRTSARRCEKGTPSPLERHSQSRGQRLGDSRAKWARPCAVAPSLALSSPP